jgi:DNA polymerase sliding clamp subunit (PCNA homolog)
MKLNTTSLRNFTTKASKIQRSNQLPVLANLKIVINNGICLITKSNLEATIIGQVDYEGEDAELLIDEHTLTTISGSTKSEFIEIVQEGTNLKLLYGKSKVTLPTETINTFPVIPDIQEAEIYKFNSDQLKAINTASKFVGEAEAMSFVQVTKDNIAAFNPQFFYINGGFNNMPIVLLRPDEIGVLPSDELEFSDLPNHHVFYQPGFTYIFTKIEAKPTSLDQVLSRLQLPGKEFSFNVSELISFCNDANNISQSQIATCTMNGSSLQLNDASYSRSIDAEYECIGTPDEFTFNSRAIVPALKTVPSGVVKAKTNSNCLIIQDGEEWFCFLGSAKS